MQETIEIAARELAWMLTDGEKTHTISDGLSEGAEIIDAYMLDGVVYLRIDGGAWD